jgi:hypothetical protein
MGIGKGDGKMKRWNGSASLGAFIEIPVLKFNVWTQNQHEVRKST